MKLKGRLTDNITVGDMLKILEFHDVDISKAETVKEALKDYDKDLLIVNVKQIIKQGQTATTRVIDDELLDKEIKKITLLVDMSGEFEMYEREKKLKKKK